MFNPAGPVSPRARTGPSPAQRTRHVICETGQRGYLHATPRGATQHGGPAARGKTRPPTLVN